MKRIFALSITLLLLFAAGAATKLYAADGFLFSVGSLNSVTNGETITVPIVVSGNPGFTAVGLEITYDPNVLEIVGVSALVPEMPLNSQFELTSTPGIQWIHLINTGLADWNGNGAIVNISFYVKSSAASGGYYINSAFTNTPNGAPANAGGIVLSGAKAVSGVVNVAENVTVNVSQPPAGPVDPVNAYSESAYRGNTVDNNTGSAGSSIISFNANNSYSGGSAVEAEDREDESVFEVIDDGGFIGGVPLSFGSADTETAATPVPPEPADFGKVPQTGVWEIGTMIVIMSVSLMMSFFLWVYVVRRKRS